MSQQFKFNILTGTDAQTKYDAITTKEPFTFYLLQTGVGYLGEKKVFDSTSLSATETMLTGKFFRTVASHVIIQADLDNTNMSKPDGTAIGDAGLLFTSDNNETDDGDEHQYFIPIKIPNTVATIDGDNPGNDIPTAAAVVNYVTQILGSYVTFEIDGTPGTATADGGICYPGVYSTDEVRIGTWINGKPLYRKVINHTFDDISIGTGRVDIANCELTDASAIETVTAFYGTYRLDAPDDTVILRPISSLIGNTADSNICCRLDIQNTSTHHYTKFVINTNGSFSCNSHSVQLIVEYTKVADNGGT